MCLIFFLALHCVIHKLAHLIVLFKEFDGNTDRFSVVSHKLKNPIITRYILINPVSYYGWISLRADFYGCKSGEKL